MSVHIEPLISFIAAPRVSGPIKATTIVTRGAVDAYARAIRTMGEHFGWQIDTLSADQLTNFNRIRSRLRAIYPYSLGRKRIAMDEAEWRAICMKPLLKKVCQSRTQRLVRTKCDFLLEAPCRGDAPLAMTNSPS